MYRIYQDGRHFDRMFPGSDTPFWLEQAAEAKGKVLELACGTGTIALPLARAGHEVTGVDLSAPMLAEARRRSSGTTALASSTSGAASSAPPSAPTPLFRSWSAAWTGRNESAPRLEPGRRPLRGSPADWSSDDGGHRPQERSRDGRGYRSQRPRLIVNLGTCGGIAGQVQVGETILAERTIVYDIIEQMTDPDDAIQHYATDLDLSWLTDVIGEDGDVAYDGTDAHFERAAAAAMADLAGALPGWLSCVGPGVLQPGL